MLLFTQEQKRVILEAFDEAYETWCNGEGDEDNLKDIETLKAVAELVDMSPHVDNPA